MTGTGSDETDDDWTDVFDPMRVEQSVEYDQIENAINRFERTIDHQIDLLREIDNKAQRVVQYTAVLIGVLFTAISLIPETDSVSLADGGLIATISFLIGLGGFLLAICAAIITFLSSVQEYGLAREFGYNVSDEVFDDQTYKQAILNSYADAVAENRRVIAVNAQRFGYSLAALFVGIVFSSLAGFLFLTSFSLRINVSLVGVATILVAVVTYGIFTERFLVLERDLPSDD
ncbi:hypothetical protein [Halorubrum sp. CSM-61]|uniref:hypothetical protein n=1 Tax=Halorubrum sp. CSM-61 TaxID=2485838 RepID=UPI000F4D17F8|nr:hypothetical protein [Halorubrum sp. CSM-61]